ncbi:amidase and AraC-type DNA-binding HTH domain-containing transcriptional regulator [Desulfocapsa sulfexigens DSM 10523]|uniref:Amidase and AraC-type DNA-binding HTH domain-containing transcriptional regulator n=1 Tax=Desulfocapsa sulfexigens (strain DSM 10523 / SB164P1) TaxID=1167006 RepID=M1P3H8_DESSD|nr:DJ-1/PfpI family protein [Desulfocapsa sulfexigens]AGF78008.1 amidase and AraC-type DNA-binding HTH domain-containing transcriptional regulator [Desulfocapsa sulfexigens DSM 10523]
MKKRLGVYICDNAEVIDWAGPTGVFAVAKRMDPELETFIIADTMAPVMATAGLRVIPKYGLNDNPSMDAFLVPGGIGLRSEIHNKRLINFVKALPEETMLVSVCTGSWVYGVAGLLDGVQATNRKSQDPSELIAPIDRLAQIAPKCIIDRHRVVDTGRIVTGGGITSGIEVGFHLLKRFGYDSNFVKKVAHIMEYEKQLELMQTDLVEINN